MDIKENVEAVKIRTGTFGRLFLFMWQNKLWWLIPLIAILAIFFVLMILAQTTPLGPFIYTIF